MSTHVLAKIVSVATHPFATNICFVIRITAPIIFLLNALLDGCSNWDTRTVFCKQSLSQWAQRLARERPVFVEVICGNALIPHKNARLDNHVWITNSHIVLFAKVACLILREPWLGTVATGIALAVAWIRCRERFPLDMRANFWIVEICIRGFLDLTARGQADCCNIYLFARIGEIAGKIQSM